MQKAIIFDWSGTLSDSFHLFSKICALMFKELGREPLSDGEIRQNFTLPYMKFWNKYFPDLSKADQDKLFDKYNHQMKRPVLYAGSFEVVKYFHSKGFKIFIISSDPETTLLIEIKASGLEKLLTQVCARVHEKQHAIINLIDKHNLDKNNTFYVGDTSGDVEAGKLAGVKTIGILWGFQHKDILEKSKPDFLIDGIRELKKLIN